MLVVVIIVIDEIMQFLCRVSPIDVGSLLGIAHFRAPLARHGDDGQQQDKGYSHLPDFIKSLASFHIHYCIFDAKIQLFYDLSNFSTLLFFFAFVLDAVVEILHAVDALWDEMDASPTNVLLGIEV